MLHQTRVELLCLGDELLVGIRTNTHLTWLGTECARHGLNLRRSQEIRDEPADIRRAFAGIWEHADLVITTGGLGPTTDDLTRETLAEILDRPLETSAEAEQDLRSFFARRGIVQPTDNNFRQCRLLRGAQFLKNPNGTAPGQWLEFDGKVLVMLPGPPNELKPMWVNEVLPRLRDRGWVQEGEAWIQLRTTGIGESQLETDLRPIFDRAGPALGVAYCAHEGMVDLRLSSLDPAFGPAEVEGVARECRENLGEAFAAFGDTCLAGLILCQIRAQGRTLAVAESCTGGLLASHFTDVPGASKVFAGGVVCYSNLAKEQILDIPEVLLTQHGAVSAECAAAMATAAAELFEADYGLSITGFAGPEGGNEPAGTIYIGFHSPHGVWARRVVSNGNRLTVKQRAVNAAFDLIRRKLLKYPTGHKPGPLGCAGI